VSDADLPDYVKVNRDHWTRNNSAYTDGNAEHAWNEQEISWGIWNTPESAVNILPDVRGKDVVELGCGTAYVAAWLKKRGARRVVGVDITPAQLDTARRMNAKYGLGWNTGSSYVDYPCDGSNPTTSCYNGLFYNSMTWASNKWPINN
jgi:SAM-dependent methyltransferase